MRQGISVCFSVLLAVLATIPAPAEVQEGAGSAPSRPLSANPYLAQLPPGVEPDFQYWNRVLRQRAAERRSRQALRGKSAPSLPETEPNNTLESADFLSTFGTDPGLLRSLDLSGGFEVPAALPSAATSNEDDGSIPLANNLVIDSGQSVLVEGQIGDGPFGINGSGSGDFDFFRLSGLEAGQRIQARIDTNDSRPGSTDFDPLLILYDSQGNVLRIVDDANRTDTDSRTVLTVPSDGNYFVAVGGSRFGGNTLSDPNDSSSGPGAGSQGGYRLTVGLDFYDIDIFTLDLKPGDIMGASAFSNVTRLTLQAPDGSLLLSSAQDLSGLYPPGSPLPGGGQATLAAVITQAGRYALIVEHPGDGAYRGELRLFRKEAIEAGPGGRQRLFIDFDGGRFSQRIFGRGSSTVNLSALRNFLPNWGLQPSDEDRVIDSIMTNLAENLSLDVRQGDNGDFLVDGQFASFDVEILNSRDHADPFGQPNVSRIIVGGTIFEAGINTVGVAQSIDVGNFNGEQTAIVLLDTLSNATSSGSVNNINLGPGSDIVDALGNIVGMIVAHEAGHFFGDYHTDFSNLSFNVMDQGVTLKIAATVGQDGLFGTSDDTDIDFGPDGYSPTEGFQGLNDTLNNIAFGLATQITVLYFPQFADGSDIVSEIVLTNPELRTALVEVQAFDSQGQIIDPATIFNDSGSLPAERSLVQGDNLRMILPPLGSVRLTGTGAGPTRVGSVQARTTPPMGGVVNFNIRGVGIAGVGASGALQQAMLPARRTAEGLSTGLAFRNPDSALPALVEVELRDASGELADQGTNTLEIVPNGQLALFLQELFPDAQLSDFEGSVTFRSSHPVAATGLEFNAAAGLISSLPVTPTVGPTP